MGWGASGLDIILCLGHGWWNRCDVFGAEEETLDYSSEGSFGNKALDFLKYVIFSRNWSYVFFKIKIFFLFVNFF